MKRVWIEGILFVVVSLAGIVEGIRLMTEKDPMKVPEPFGPGAYLVVIGICLLSAGVVHILVHAKDRDEGKRADVGAEKRGKVLRLSAVLAVYVALINVVGYAVATPLFFLGAFRITGMTSWRSTFILSVILSAAFYLVFVYYCNMVFPRLKGFGL